MPNCVSNKFLEEIILSHPYEVISDIAKELIQCRKQLRVINKDKISPSTRPRSRRRELTRLGEPNAKTYSIS